MLTLDLFADQQPEAPAFTMADLVAAWLACRRTKRNSASALAFEQEVERNLATLYDELAAREWRPGRSICFVVTQPKPREVWAAPIRDRVVHHLLYSAIAPRFEARFVAGSAACIEDRGTLYAAKRLEHDVRSVSRNWSRPAWYIKCDLANFFVSIQKPVLQAQLRARVHEPFWRWLTDTVLMHDPRTDYEWRGRPQLLARVPPHKRLTNAPAGTGLPIGNLSSQFFANVHLNALDQRAKHALHARYYGRYVDDFYLLHESPDWLNAAHGDLAEWLPRALGVRLNDSKTILQPVARGVDFVGQVVKPWRRTTRKRTRLSALARIEQLPASEVYAAGNSYLGLVRQASHSRRDQARIAAALLKRGHAVDGDMTKIFRNRQC